jgi:hypothetical protein
MTAIRRFLLAAAAITTTLAACAAPTAPAGSAHRSDVPTQPNTDTGYQGGFGRTPSDSTR